MEDKFRVRGWIKIAVYTRDGVLKSYEEHSNVTTDVGKAQIVALMSGTATNSFQYIAIGTGTTAPASTDTAMETEVSRKAGTVSQKTTTVTNDTMEVQATFSNSDGLSGSATISETGLLDASSGGNLIAHASVSNASVDWDAGDSLSMTWDVQIQ